ncbi:MAG: GNAT family N-acetyltransferase [Bacteroidota bacterium]
MTLEYLADRPDFINTIAQWYFDEWGNRMTDNNLTKEIENVKLYLNKDKIPLIIVATDGAELLGVAQLKFREMDMYPEKEHWLGGVYVSPAHRGKNIAVQMIGKIIALAKTLGVKKLYLQTIRLDGGLYARLGWQPIEQVFNNGQDVLVMERDF